MAYWRRVAPHTLAPTEHVGGAWSAGSQHIAPALGALAHEVERDLRRRRDDDLHVARLSYDILGVVPLEPIEVAVEVVRPGRTIELVEATASYAGRVVVRLRAWVSAAYDTAALAGTGLAPIDGPDDLEPWDMSSLWPGGFIASVDVRRRDLGPGRSTCWVRTPHALVDDEQVSPLAATAGLLDIANGIAVRLDPTVVQFPNVDLTAHLLRPPALTPAAGGEPGGWLGFDTTVSVGPGGLGVTSTVLHDVEGPLGTIAQSLTVRPG